MIHVVVNDLVPVFQKIIDHLVYGITNDGGNKISRLDEKKIRYLSQLSPCGRCYVKSITQWVYIFG